LIKPFWKSKTILVNVVAGVILYFFQMPEVGAAPELSALVLAGVNLILRVITKEPVGLKPE